MKAAVGSMQLLSKQVANLQEDNTHAQWHRYSDEIGPVRKGTGKRGGKRETKRVKLMKLTHSAGQWLSQVELATIGLLCSCVASLVLLLRDFVNFLLVKSGNLKQLLTVEDKKDQELTANRLSSTIDNFGPKILPTECSRSLSGIELEAENETISLREKKNEIGDGNGRFKSQFDPAKR